MNKNYCFTACVDFIVKVDGSVEASSLSEAIDKAKKQLFHNHYRLEDPESDAELEQIDRNILLNRIYDQDGNPTELQEEVFDV